MTTSSSSVFLGVDGGGTGCRSALALADGHIIGRGEAGSANVWSDTAGTVRNIISTAHTALRDAGLEGGRIADIRAVIGVAGADDLKAVAALAAGLPFKSALIRSDAEIALHGALGDEDGAIASIGTGTIYLRRRGSETRRVSGYGFQVSDLGGGAYMGRRLLEDTILAHDGVRVGTVMTAQLLDRFGGPVGIAEFAKQAAPKDFAALVPEIMHHDALGDPIAQGIVGDAVAAIADALVALDLGAGEPLCFLGGLSQFIVPRLPSRYRQAARPPRQDAAGGALSLALRHHWIAEGAS